MSVKQTAPSGDSAMARHAASMVFPIGAPNDGFAQYFTGRSFLAPVSTEQVGIFNVTFEPGCRNNWHIHHAKSGGGQILICVAGRGFYQEWGRAAVELLPEGRGVYVAKNTSQSASLLSQRGPALLGQKNQVRSPALLLLSGQADTATTNIPYLLPNVYPQIEPFPKSLSMIWSICSVGVFAFSAVEKMERTKNFRPPTIISRRSSIPRSVS